MDRGRNLEALAEEDDEEEMEEEHKDSDGSESSTSDDDTPDEGIKRGEPNKFDILCDGVSNAMALVHTALEELLDMKDEMLRHQLPPTLLIKLATNTGKVFRSISDLNMPVNELLRLVRVYSTPWEEKSAALKKLHEDYEAKQRQLNIAIKRLQLVDAHSKRIAREKRVMNWEKLFAKVMSHKGHGRRWKFLIDTIKQKAKLGLEHVQEFTKQLDESSDEEEDEMPTIQLKRHDGASPTSTSDKVSMKKSKRKPILKPSSVSPRREAESDQGEEEGEEKEAKEGEESDAGSDTGEAMPVTEVPSIKIGEAEEEEEDEDEEPEEESDKRSRSSESAKKVRFAEELKRASPKVETKDAEVWTDAPDYDHYLFVRMYCPINMDQTEVKCSVTLGKQYYKTKRLDEEGKPPSGDLPPNEVKKGRFEEASFLLPPTIPEGVWPGKTPPPAPPKNFQISVNTGPKDAMYAMATIEIEDLKALDLKVVDLPPLAGDDDVPKAPDPKADDDLDSLASDLEIPLPDEEKQDQEVVDRVKDVEPMMFPLYSLDGSSAMHKSCGNLPLILYWGKKAKPQTMNRQCGTHGVTELVFEMTGIDLHTTSKADLHKEMVDDSTSVINFAPDTMDRALSALHFTPEPEPVNPPASPEQESIPEEVVPEVKEPTPEPEPIPEEPKEEMIPKIELDKVMEKHSKDMLFLQEEYEKQLQQLMQSLQLMEQNQQDQQQQIKKQQQQIQTQQKELSRRTASPHFTQTAPLSATRKGPDTDEVSKPIIHAPMPPPKPKTRGPRKRQPQTDKAWEGVPDEFLDRLQYFEEVSYRNRQDLVDKIKQDIQSDIEKKLAGQHKLSKREEEMFDALNDVSLPALFMPYHRGTVFNPRAHQYFHPTGSSDLRLSQPPSVFQLPPLHRSSSSVLNLFELSKNFNTRGPGWLMDRYIQQQEPVKNAHGMMPHTSVPTSQLRSPPYTPQPTYDMPSTRGGDEPRQRVLETEAEC